MSKNTLYIFSAEWCVNCGPLKDRLKSLSIDFKEIDIEKDENADMVSKYTIRSLPTAVIEGPEGETVYMQAGTGALDGVRKIMQAS